ncbi:MAG TPA: RsmB/NOP family class I SAM-dependent RNA methyltransferase [Spirochaetota bacterium]|jgi:16S rRNA (cytosine1407-C5)-methyltransferase|nr:MAG: Ribosomal RNA small subunit methyltransferase F [Spirochaetes bacterium ADurb.Bin133]HNZ26956.1 RsmB/NOP family class I SAM-dependent RNA methyltransferase [Spirochaetota bacterium]HPY88866.1 RsmB/NOP family class I SAM-dependent RNA methyltransferase [Spirochaetota bacterium]HQB61524.1 RsmB/NOP family class I SAM-dependent RNA methyltransferase [Spirochaetota bacterium]
MAMRPIGDVYKLIPGDALAVFKELFSPVQYDKIIQSFRIERRTTFRLNTLKSTKREVMDYLRNNKFKFQEINFIDNAFILEKKDGIKLLKTDLAVSGKIYLQTLSSMLPPIALGVEQNERILDLASAPGSKTTQIAALMNNTGIIDAVEPNFIRIERLRHNINLLGVTNTTVTQADGNKFCVEKANYYDRVLLDAPCSGDGRFNIYDRKSYGNWRKNMAERCSNIQKKLLRSALTSVKPGGTVVYSTCAINDVENEGVVNSILESGDFKIEIENINIPRLEGDYVTEGLARAKENKYSRDMRKCLRILPSNIMEGFFVCKIKKV